jgi:hypothetical protein
MKKYFLLVLTIVLIAAGCNNKATQPPSQAPNNEQSSSNTIKYSNNEYGFTFDLPKSWEGYQIITDKWQGQSTTQPNQNIAEGPQLNIRHPQWTIDNPRQDIPIMVFTLEQWNNLQTEKFHVGAAPVGPSELARNNKYIFALPARYNFAFPTGYEEAEQLIQNKALKAFDVQ